MAETGLEPQIQEALEASPASGKTQWQAAVLAVCVLIADQLSKLWFLEVVTAAGKAIAIMPGFNLVMAWNRGVSFGIFSEHDAKYALIALSLVICGVLVFWMRREPDRIQVLAMGAIIGGALGNVVDRFRFGAVFDFLDVYVGAYHWPAFNVADSFIVCGVLVLMWRSFR